MTTKAGLVLGWPERLDRDATYTDDVPQAVLVPASMITEKFDILGQSGGGKTYLAMKMAELMLAHEGQIVVIDPAGVWWGLRRGGVPGRKGYSVVVLGGEHGDVPLSADSGALVAELVVNRRLSTVLDISDMADFDQTIFVTAFVSRFFELKKRNKSPVHVFFEECQEFFPEDLPSKGAHRMRSVCVRMMKIGRNYGIGWTAITQEPQAASKRALNQAGTIIAVRTIGRQERDAIAKTASSRTSTKKQLDLIDVLPDLETGQALLWSPSWLGHAGVIRIEHRETFDASATPKAGEHRAAAGEMGAVDLAQLRASMASMLEAQRATDPTALQARVRELEGQLAERPAPAAIEKVVEVPVLSGAQQKEIHDLITATSTLATRTDRLYSEINAAHSMGVMKKAETRDVVTSREIMRKVADTETFSAIMENARHGWDGNGQPPGTGDLRARSTYAEVRTTATAALRDTVAPGMPPKVAKYVAGVLGALADRHPLKVSIGQLALIAGRSARSSAFENALAAMRRHNLIEENIHQISVTPLGWRFLGRDPTPGVASPSALREKWASNLGEYERPIFRALVAVYPGTVGREELAGMVSRSANSSAYENAIALLKKNGLAVQKGPLLAAAPMLFGVAS